MDGDDVFFETGREALKDVTDKKGTWNWVLLGADENELPLAGGGSGFVDEMRECLQTIGDAVVFGMLKLTFNKNNLQDGGNQGEVQTFKWVMVFATLDEGSTMSAVQRGKALSKKPAMEKVLKGFATVTCILEITEAADLTLDVVVQRVKKVSVLDGELMVPEIVSRASPQASSKADAPPQVEEVEMIEEVYEESPESHAPEEPPAPSSETPAVETTTEPAKDESEPAPSPTEEEPKEEEKAEAPPETTQPDPTPEEPKAETKPDEAPKTEASAEKKTGVKVGDLVDIGSHTEGKWFTDGIIEEVRVNASTTHEGKPLPAGCGKIVYNAGSRGKWLQPEALNDRSVVKPSIRPTTFTGFLKKETHNILSEWHVRYFELKDGYLTWWITLEDARTGVKPQTSLELVGLQMKAPAQSSKFSIRTASSKGVVYNFDAATGAGYHPVEEWAANLRQHAAYANRMYKFRQAAGMK
jgi:outer membrane biosynthesis protein TonB